MAMPTPGARRSKAAPRACSPSRSISTCCARRSTQGWRLRARLARRRATSPSFRARRPTGKSLRFIGRRSLQCQASLRKIFLFHFSEIHDCLPPSRPDERDVRVVTNVGRVAMDALRPRDERLVMRTAKSRGPGAPTLASSLADDDREATVAKKPGTPGRSRISRKPFAQGMPDRFGVPVVTCLRAFFVARKAAGAFVHPAFPAPSVLGSDVDAQLRQILPRECSCSSLRGAQRRSNPDYSRGNSLDCFASLAMTAELFDN